MRLQAGQGGHAQIEIRVAFAAAPQHEFDKKIVHDALGRCGQTTHEIDGQFLPPGGCQDVGEGHDMPVQAHQRAGKVGEISGLEIAQGEALFPGVLLCQPAIRNPPEFVQQRRHRRRRHDLEAEPVPLGASMGLAQFLARRSLQRESGEGNHAFLAQFHGGQAQIQVEGQVFRIDLVENGASAVAIRHLAEPPDQRFARALRADRIAHGNPALAAHLIHDERLTSRVEQQALVAQQGKGGVALRGGGDDAGSVCQVLSARPAGFGRRRPQQMQQRQAACRQNQQQGRAQEARGVALQGELPPQLMGIIDMLEREQSQPNSGGQQQRDREHPARRKTPGKEGGGPIEGVTPQPEHAQDQRGKQRLLVIQAFDQGGQRA